jgi:hypothetical protein
MEGADQSEQNFSGSVGVAKKIPCRAQKPPVLPRQAALLVRARRKLPELTDLDLLDREHAVMAVRGALDGRLTHSDAANAAIAKAMTENSAELVNLLEELVLRAIRQCSAESLRGHISTLA